MISRSSLCLDGTEFVEVRPSGEDLRPDGQYSVFHPAEVELSDRLQSIVREVQMGIGAESQSILKVEADQERLVTVRVPSQPRFAYNEFSAAGRPSPARLSPARCILFTGERIPRRSNP